MHESAPLDPRELAERAGVTVRAAEPSDSDALHVCMSDPAVIPGTLQVPYTSAALRAERWSFTDPNRITVVAESVEGGEVVGNAGLHRAPQARRLHVGWLGMSVNGDWQGRGVGSALLAAVLDVADNWWQVRRVHLEVFTDNEPAIALYRKFGFELEGTLRQDAFRDGEYADTHVMGRLRRN